MAVCSIPSQVPNGCTESGILGPGKVRHVAKSAIRPDGSVHFGVAAIRNNTADTPSIAQ